MSIQREIETPRGWAYDVHIVRGSGPPTDHRVTMSWADHDHWSGGALPPSSVVQSLMEVLAERLRAHELPHNFDASTARRWVEGLDDLMLQRAPQ
ncbi:MAG: hypothetical protein RBS39_11765 [Phycisphaerales bacterium]|nr:hypothetical protein [Phycisphaerales bacterium]